MNNKYKIIALNLALLTAAASYSFAETSDDLFNPGLKGEVEGQLGQEESDTYGKPITYSSDNSTETPTTKNPSATPEKKATKKPTAEKPKDKNSKTSLLDKAKEKSSQLKEKVVIEADDLSYDRESKTLTAENNVVLGYMDKEMHADKIEYNQDTRLINAQDGVKYTDGQGMTINASSIMATDQFDKGEMKDVNVTFPDGSSFESRNLTILDVNKYNLTKSDFSPCKPCENGKKFWKLSSSKIVYNEDEGRVYYRDSYLKILDHKVMYLPYISHPTPSAKSKSGFLTPKFGQSSDYGFFAQVPYYYQPRENLDFTFSPILTAQDGPILVNEMRNLVESGYYELEFSAAYPEERDDFGNKVLNGGNDFRGHVKGKGDFTFAENWGYGFDAVRSTDDTYLRRYKLGVTEDVLTSEAYINWLNDRDYFSAKALSFQGLRATDDPSVSPYILPLIDAGKTFQVSDKYNNRIETKFNSLLLRRDLGPDTSRAIGDADWKADYTTSSGHLFNFNLGTRADYYYVDEVPYLGGTYDGSVNRVMPTATATWSYPLQKVGGTYSVIIEPIAMAIISPNGSNTIKIPNEDSQNVEISDYNLFQESHISGYDIVEDGFRSNYGMRGVLNSDSLGDFNFLLGQNYRANEDNITFPASSGMSDNFSDYVGRIVTGSERIQSSYRFRLDKDSLEFKRNEIGFNINVNPIQLNTGYTFIDGTGPLDPDRQEIYTGGKIKLTDTVNLLTQARRNLNNDASAGWVNAGGGIEFVNDCINTSFEVNREFTRDRDIEPTTNFIVRFALQNFGS